MSNGLRNLRSNRPDDSGTTHFWGLGSSGQLMLNGASHYVNVASFVITLIRYSSMDWINQHASEILVAIITAIIIKVIDYLLAKRSKLFFFYTNAAQFHIPVPGQQGPTAHTITLALWNNGRAVAEKVRIVHFRLPNHYQVWPPLATTTNVLQSGHVELQLPQILPNQIVFVSYFDFVPLTAPQIIAQIEAKVTPPSQCSFSSRECFQRG